MGLTVVVNGSRGYLNTALRKYPELRPVLVDVAPEILRNRLARRGRESQEAIKRRLPPAFDHYQPASGRGSLRVTFLGTGGAGGVPRFGCTCAACQRAKADSQHVRRPCSALIYDDNHKILLDAGLIDLHESFEPGELSAIVLTHYHADHVQGLLHLRWGKGEPIPVYAPPDPQGFTDLFKHPGILDIHELRAFVALELGDFSLTPLPLNHSKLTFGYVVAHREGARFAYLTDTIGLPKDSDDFLIEWEANEIAVDCSHPPAEATGNAPQNHNDVTAALEMIQRSGAKQGWLMDNASTLPKHVTPAADGQVVDLVSETNRT